MNYNSPLASLLRRSLLLAMLTPAAQAVSAPPVHDIDGVWSYAETSLLVLKPDEETLHVTCLLSDGVLVINQSGANYSGTLTHYSTSCMTKDGDPVPAPWDLPYEAYLSGRITGRGLHIDQFDAPPAPPIHCPKQGSIMVADGEVVELRTTGRCDLSDFPFPFKAKNFGVAVRP